MTELEIPQSDGGLSQPEHLSQAMRIGLAEHPRFAGAIYKRLIVDCLYEVPTQSLSLSDIVAAIPQRFEQMRLTASRVRQSLEELQSAGMVSIDRIGKSGERQYRLTPDGQRDWSVARSEGAALRERVKLEFAKETRMPVSEIDGRWNTLLEALDRLFKAKAYDLARALLEDAGHLSSEVPGNVAEPGSVQTSEDLATFLRSPVGDRYQFLKRLVLSTLGYHLFRATPNADAEVKEHLKNRTLYLDTTVLYALCAEHGDLAAFRDDMLRLGRELNCRFRVSTETLKEFHDSVARYKARLGREGWLSAEIARAVLTQTAVDEFDDFTRGFYTSIIRDASVTLDLYSTRYETIEERLQQWGILSVAIPPMRRAQGGAPPEEMPPVEEYAQSLINYLHEHPRVGAQTEVNKALIMHDVVNVAWIQRERAWRKIAMPTLPSQVAEWFLTRDRRLCAWDRDYVRDHGLGRIPRCLGLEEWIESIAMFSASLQQSDAVGAVLLRLLFLEAPPLGSDEEPRAEFLVEIGRQADSMRAHGRDAARLAADRGFLKQLALLPEPEKRVDAIRAALMALKETQVSALEGEVVDLGETVESLTTLNSRLAQDKENLTQTIQDLDQQSREQADTTAKALKAKDNQIEDFKEKVEELGRTVDSLAGRIIEMEKEGAARTTRRVRTRYLLAFVVPELLLLIAAMVLFVRTPAASHWFGKWRVALPLITLAAAGWGWVATRAGTNSAEVKEWWAYRAVRWCSLGLAGALGVVILSIIGNLATSHWAEPLMSAADSATKVPK